MVKCKDRLGFLLVDGEIRHWFGFVQFMEVSQMIGQIDLSIIDLSYARFKALREQSGG